MPDETPVTLEQLEKMNRMHRAELRKIKKMSETQFQVFKKNFSVGQLEKITKIEAEELLTSMLALNIQIQSEIPRRKE